MANFTQSTFDPSKRQLINRMRREIYMSQLVETYHHNKHITEVLQQRLCLSRQQEYVMRSGISSANFQVQEKINNSSSLYNQFNNQRLMMFPQEADVFQIGRNSQINFNKGAYPYPSIDVATLSNIPRVMTPRTDYPPVAATIHYKPNGAEYLHYSVHRLGKDGSHLNIGGKRSLNQSLTHQWSNTDREYYERVQKRPRLSPGISPTSLCVQNQVVDKSLGAVFTNPTLQTAIVGNLPSPRPIDQHYDVSSQHPLSHITISNIRSQSVSSIRHIERRTEQEGISVPITLENRTHLAIPSRSQRTHTYGGTTTPHPLEHDLNNMATAQYSTMQISSGFRVSQREDYNTPFAIGNQEVVGERRGAVAMSPESIHINKQHVTTDPNGRRNVSECSTNSNTFDANTSVGLQSERPLRCEVIKKEVQRMIPETISYTSTNNSQLEQKPEQYQTMTTWNANYGNHGRLLKAQSPGTKMLHEKSHETNIRSTEQNNVHVLDNCFHEVSGEKRECDSKTDNLTPNNFKQEILENHDQKQTSKNIHESSDNIIHVTIPKQKEKENDEILKDMLKSRRGMKMTYGTFLQEIIVPMTLAVSQEKSDRKQCLQSILEVWQKQRKLLTFDGKSDEDVYFKNVEAKNGEDKKEIKTTKQEVSKTSVPKTNSVDYCNGSTQSIRNESDEVKGMTCESARIISKEENSCLINLDEGSIDDVKLSKQESDNNVEAGFDHPHRPTSVNDIDETLSKDVSAKSDLSRDHTLTENDDEDQLNLSNINSCRRKSVRVVLKMSDRIKMKFYNIGSYSYSTKEKQYSKSKKRNGDFTIEKKIMMRIGSERLFTRSYRSTISPKKSLPAKSKRKQQRRRNKLTSVPKDFTRIAIAVHKTSGETILHRIVRLNAKNVLRYCLDSGYNKNVNVTDHAGYTPLHECCVFGRLWIAEQLIYFGADINVSAHDGTRPLHDAVENGYTELVRLLLSHGADPLIPTYAKRTALDNAKSEAIRKLLLDYITDVNGTSDDLTAKWKTSTSPSKIRFRTSYSIQGNALWEDTFLDTSSLDTVDKNGMCNPLLYVKETPHPDHFRLQLKEEERIKNWYFLFDVLSRLSIPAATFPYLYPHIKVHGLPTDIFLKKVDRARGILQYYHPEVYSTRELIEFVEADDEMSAILQLEGWTC